jgi:hypothetical protein
MEDIPEAENYDIKKELNKISYFERYNNLENNKCLNCKKNANYICLLDNKFYCWYHAIIKKKQIIDGN